MSAKIGVHLTLSEILEKYETQLVQKRPEEVKKNVSVVKSFSAGAASASLKSQTNGQGSNHSKKHSCVPKKLHQLQDERPSMMKPTMKKLDIRHLELKPSPVVTPGSVSSPSTAGTDSPNSDDDGKGEDGGLEDQALKNEERSKAIGGNEELDFARKIEAMSANWRLDTLPKPKNFYAVFLKKTHTG